MITVKSEVAALEERLKQAELGPDPTFFEQYLDDELVIVSNGEVSSPKAKIVEAHQPGKGQKFTRVEMTDMQIVEHGTTAVVTCKGHFETDNGVSHDLKFMRVWAKKNNCWKIVAGTIA